MLSVETESDATGTVRLSGSLTRQEQKDYQISDQNPHVANIGKMVEEIENRLRATIDVIYFGKTMEVLSTVRSFLGMSEVEKRKLLSASIHSQISAKAPR
jgi:capping protein beta